MSDPQEMDWFEPNHAWARGDEGLPVNSPREDHDIDHAIDIDLHAPRARNNDNLYKDIYGDPIQPNPTDNALDPAQPVKLPGIETILNPIRRATDANFPYQTPQSDGIELNNSRIQLPSEMDCYAYDIYSSERLINAGGCEINPFHSEIKPLHNEIERLQDPNLPGPEVLNTRDSTNYDQDTETQNVPQQEATQVHSALAPGSLLQTQPSSAPHYTNQSCAPPPLFAQMQAPEPMQTTNALDETNQSWPSSSFSQAPVPQSMQVCLPNGPSPSIFNQNSTTGQQPTSSQYDLYSRPEEHGIDLNNQFILPSELTYDAYDIYSSERLMNASGCETNPLRDEPEQHRYSNIPGREVLNAHNYYRNSTMTIQNIIAYTNYNQDAEMQNVPQQEHDQFMEQYISEPGDLSQQASNVPRHTAQSSASSFAQMPASRPMKRPDVPCHTSQPSNSSYYTSQPSTSSFAHESAPEPMQTIPRLDTDEFYSWMKKKITNLQNQREEKFRKSGGGRLDYGGVNSFREYKKTRNERTSNPSEEHKKKTRQESIGSYKKRNEDEEKKLDEYKSQLEAMIKSEPHESNEQSDNRPNPDEMEDETKYQQKLNDTEVEKKLLKEKKKEWEAEKKKIDFGSISIEVITKLNEELKTDSKKWNWPDDFKNYIDMVKKGADLQNLLLPNSPRNLSLLGNMIMVHALDKLYKKEENRLDGQKFRTKGSLKRVGKINDVKKLKLKCEQATSSQM